MKTLRRILCWLRREHYWQFDVPSQKHTKCLCCGVIHSDQEPTR